jgi:hypothetical protein
MGKMFLFILLSTYLLFPQLGKKGMGGLGTQGMGKVKNIVIVTPPQTPSTLLDSLVAGWKGGTLTDVTSGGNDLSIFGDVAITTGVGNSSAYSLGGGLADGIYIDVPSNILQLGGCNFSIVLWVKSLDSSACNFITSNTGVFAFNYNDNGKSGLMSYPYIGYSIECGDNLLPVDFSGTILDTLWHCYTILHSVSGLTSVYIGNTLLNTETTNVINVVTPDQDGATPFSIGMDWYGWSTYNGLKGSIGDCYIWHRILTSDERATLYNSGLGKQYPFTP